MSKEPVDHTQHMLLFHRPECLGHGALGCPHVNGIGTQRHPTCIFNSETKSGRHDIAIHTAGERGEYPVVERLGHPRRYAVDEDLPLLAFSLIESERLPLAVSHATPSTVA
jgi:hypothetical protein